MHMQKHTTTSLLVYMCLLFSAVSEAPVAAPPPKKYQSYNPNYKTDEEKKEEVCTFHLIIDALLQCMVPVVLQYN